MTHHSGHPNPKNNNNNNNSKTIRFLSSSTNHHHPTHSTTLGNEGGGSSALSQRNSHNNIQTTTTTTNSSQSQPITTSLSSPSSPSSFNSVSHSTSCKNSKNTMLSPSNNNNNLNNNLNINLNNNNNNSNVVTRTASSPTSSSTSMGVSTRKFSLNREVFINNNNNSSSLTNSSVSSALTTNSQPQPSIPSNHSQNNNTFSWNFADRRPNSSSGDSPSTNHTTNTTTSNNNSILYLNLDENISSSSMNEHQRPINHQRNRNKGSGGISEYSFTVDDLLQTSPTIHCCHHHSHSNSFGSSSGGNHAGGGASTITVVGVSSSLAHTSNSSSSGDSQNILTNDMEAPLTEFINLDLTSILPHQKLLRFFLRNNQSYFTNASQMGKHSPVIAQEMSLQQHDLFGNLNVGGDYYSDISIRFVPSGREIHAHKFMLSMYSPVLAAMFNSQWKDSQQNVIEIVTELSGLSNEHGSSYEDIDDEQLFVEMILCMYSGQVYQIEQHLVVPLLEISDKYQFTELCRACEEYLRVHLNEHNCISLLYLSGGSGIGTTTSTSPNTNANMNTIGTRDDVNNNSKVLVNNHSSSSSTLTSENNSQQNMNSNNSTFGTINNSANIYHTKKVNSIGKFERLRERALTYIDTHFEKVSKTKSFLFLDLETLVFLLGRGELRVDSEDIILDAILRWCEGDLEQRREFLFTTLLEQVRLYHLSPNRLAHLGEVLEKFTNPRPTSHSSNVTITIDQSSSDDTQHEIGSSSTHHSTVDPTIMNWMNRIINAMSFQLSQSLGFQLSTKMQQKIAIESPPRKRATQDITRISSLLSQEQFLQILEWINEQGKLGLVKDLSEREWLVLYRGSKDGFNGKSFHQKCDGKGPTFTVIKTDKGFMFGGFTSKSWHSGNTDESDESAFLFSLYNPYLNNKMTRFKIKSGMSAAIGCYANFGVIFGGGRDLIIYGDCNINNSSHCEFFGHTYQLPNLSGVYYGSLKSKTFFNGTEQFRVSDIEVFGLVPSNKDSRKK